jgi:Na+-transporting methylmalonyl-CoA/oxaloacetate decarboxylase gamma subunit
MEVDDREHHPEPGLGLALLTVLGMILTIGVLSLLIWALMIAVAATTAGRSEHAPAPSEMMIEQKALPAKP